MTERTDAGESSRPRLPRTPRVPLVMSAALALALHLVFLGGAAPFRYGAPESAYAPMSVRMLAATPAVEAVEAPVEAVPTAFVAAPPEVAKPARRRPSREPAPARSPQVVAVAHASASSSQPPEPMESLREVAIPASADPLGVAALREPLPSSATADELAVRASDTVAVAEPPSSAPPADARAPASGGSPALLAPGDRPPPVYKTHLPPSATLHYEVRRGFLSGEGEIRWQSSGGAYRLVLEARIAGLTLLMQTSEGSIDANGIAPARFLDKRARRAAQAANFRRELGKVTFSGTGVEWPLPGGSQDRLSWMIQLAGIAAAQPQLLVEGSRITMAVFGARGDAAVWSLRYAGHEAVVTPGGSVRAIKLVREPSSAHDTGAEVWLDPERAYLPVRATLLDSAGSPDYDLLLERIEAAR